MGVQRVSQTRSVTEPSIGSSVPKGAGMSLFRARASVPPAAGRVSGRADLGPTNTLPGQTSGTVARLHGASGFSFARLAIHPAQRLPGRRERLNTPQEKIDGKAARAIAQSHTRSALPESVRDRLEVSTGHSFAHIAVHDDSAAQHAADLLGSRAFTLGRDVYFARGQYAPWNAEGMRLLAHEAAHTLQQNRAVITPSTDVEVGPPADRLEYEADQFASAIMAGVPAPPLSSSDKAQRVQRAVSFTYNSHRPTKIAPMACEYPDWLIVCPGERGDAFTWDADVTAHGAKGDSFGNYEAGFLQALTDWRFDAVWGDPKAPDAQYLLNVKTPMRDALNGKDIWASPNEPDFRPPFGADGDVRSLSRGDRLNRGIKWENPKHPGKTHVGEFHFDAKLTTYLGVRDSSMTPDAKAAFHILAHVDWSRSVHGTWNDKKAVGKRVTLEEPKADNGDVIDGDSTAFPAIVGGPVPNEAAEEIGAHFAPE